MKHFYFILLLAGLIVSAKSIANTNTANSGVREELRPVKIVYFIPTDREPEPDRAERLGRVMRCVQNFYRDGMEKHGYGPMTFALEWDSPNKIKLYEVRGKKKMEEYGRNDASAVRNEVRDALKEQYDIDAGQEYLVIFQLLLKNEGDKSIEVGPYVGGGNSFSGTAWVYEDKRLDADQLTNKEPGGYYNGPCSIGKFNTHYIGGVAHEMGHGFGLPHVCEWNTQRPVLGNALMGSGNHTFGRDLRNEGTGTFLAETSALRLTAVSAFVGNLPGAAAPEGGRMRGGRSNWTLEDLTAKDSKDENGNTTIVISGRVTATSKLLGIIAYNDNANIPADYDAKAWMTKDLDNGRFNITLREIESVPYQLRLVGVHENGTTSQISVSYEVTEGKSNIEQKTSERNRIQ